MWENKVLPFFNEKEDNYVQINSKCRRFGLIVRLMLVLFDGHRTGIITSTSLLAGGDAFTEAVSMAKENPKLGIGIHIGFSWWTKTSM